MSELTFTIENKQYQVTVDAKEAILDVLLENGYNIPYSCRSGFCTECKAKLLSGSVDLEVKTGLDEQDIKENYILTCQAYPTSQKLEITYDGIPLPPEFLD
ncbi:2Fe-2S iron-sulfur cluster-binding protein [Candidatus Uabimicrobium amorphum]|uniref:Phenylacetic acid degradation protein n=1 Tax=Uabimicrobium amorphum TaxID=2596890 RepID=A0A5S9IWG3_UABAM|nr:2Fe-2S iron-sulfur cluster binding domain-containing protein [Candidatus Uabimicrobium amorphum]BBM87805.1 phenylacetic acid degradation protein [Candidatus Uabimicrobium amorphum]